MGCGPRHEPAEAGFETLPTNLFLFASILYRYALTTDLDIAGLREKEENEEMAH